MNNQQLEAKVRRQYESCILQVQAENKEREELGRVVRQADDLAVAIEELLKKYSYLRKADSSMADVVHELGKHCPYTSGPLKDPVKETLSWIVSEARKLQDPKAAAEQVVQMTLILSKMISGSEEPA